MVGDFNDKRSSKIVNVVSVQVAVKAKFFYHSVSISAKVSLKLSPQILTQCAVGE